METIEIYEISNLNYSVCEYLLRNRLREVHILCPSIEIIDSLSIYMTEIGIPWSIDPNKPGISLSSDEKMPSSKFHIYIYLDQIPQSLTNNNSHCFIVLLRNIEQETINKLLTDPETFDLSSVPLHLQNEEIRKMFLKAFILADNEIDIISPWMNFNVVNDALMGLMKQALQRGVLIRIIYGLLPGTDEYNQVRSTRSDLVAMRLRESFKDFGDAFRVSRDNIHYKLVLCDEKFKLEGSFNYLSFTGDYSNQDMRREGSPFGRDVNEIRYLRKEYFSNGPLE